MYIYTLKALTKFDNMLDLFFINRYNKIVFKILMLKNERKGEN